MSRWKETYSGYQCLTCMRISPTKDETCYRGCGTETPHNLPINISRDGYCYVSDSSVYAYKRYYYCPECREWNIGFPKMETSAREAFICKKCGEYVFKK